MLCSTGCISFAEEEFSVPNPVTENICFQKSSCCWETVLSSAAFVPSDGVAALNMVFRIYI